MQQHEYCALLCCCRFVSRFEALLQRVRQEEGPLRVAVVGGGAAGVELACALQYRCGGLLWGHVTGI